MVTATVCFVQRDRLVPLYTGLESLYSGYRGGGAHLSYQQVPTRFAASVRGRKTKYTVDDMEEEDDESAL